ncbi:MAG: histidine phosphatase family protein, partial [Opitutaceae bacterium]
MIYLIRHGETEWARDGRHTGRTDLPLTERGRVRARLLRPFFESAAFEAILSSPLARATETAELAGIGRDRLNVLDDLHEWDYGDYEGRTTEEIRRMAPGWTIWTQPCPHGETIGEVAARADRAIGGLDGRRGDC